MTGRDDFGTIIRAIRSDQGRSLRDVATAAGITHSGLSRIELGSRPASLDTLCGLCRALKISIVIKVDGAVSIDT